MGEVPAPLSTDDLRDTRNIQLCLSSLSPDRRSEPEPAGGRPGVPDPLEGGVGGSLPSQELPAHIAGVGTADPPALRQCETQTEQAFKAEIEIIRK